MATAFKPARAPERGGTFRILIGDHLGQGPDGCQCDDCLRTGGKDHRYRARRYSRQGEALDPPDYDNDVIDSTVDLALRYNAGPNSRKFERMQAAPRPARVEPEGGPPPAGHEEVTRQRVEIPDNLDALPRRYLDEFAKSHSVDVSECKTRDEVAKAIRSALG